MCLKYHKGSLKTQSRMPSTICLPRFSSSLPLKCNVHKKTIKRTFKGCNVGLKVRGKKWINIFGNVELKVKKIYGASDSLPKKQNNSNPKIEILPLINEENELHKLLFLFSFLFFYFFFFTYFFHFFCFCFLF